jgi:drug/metabolite transporter (DMT)-like permease
MGLGIQLMILAGALVAISNLCMRKSVDAAGSSKAFLVVQLFLTFIVAILLNPVRSGNYSFSISMALLGLIAGAALAVMMYCLGKAVESGPASLSFAMVSCATVMPILFMVTLFGSRFGFSYTLYHGVGSLLVIAGIVWAGWQTISLGGKGRWFIFACGALLFHAFFLVFMQWRALCIAYPGAEGLFLPLDEKALSSQWFMPMAFLSATAIQLFLFVRENKTMPHPSEITFGALGGLANGIGTFLMIKSTELATPLEQAMIFPLFAVAIMVGCNLWGQILYKEKVNWKASIFCIAGVAIGTVDWSVW